MIPLIEDLLSKWEDKLNDPKFTTYHDPIQDGITKLKKYYCGFDDRPAFVLALCKLPRPLLFHNTHILILVLHPNYGLDYIKLAWGGEDEWLADIAKGVPNAKNWQREAQKILEKTVSNLIFLLVDFI